jgi:hypothetical protein
MMNMAKITRMGKMVVAVNSKNAIYVHDLSRVDGVSGVTNFDQDKTLGPALVKLGVLTDKELKTHLKLRGLDDKAKGTWWRAVKFMGLAHELGLELTKKQKEFLHSLEVTDA